jgi:hypothetical protein
VSLAILFVGNVLGLLLLALIAIPPTKPPPLVVLGLFAGGLLVMCLSLLITIARLILHPLRDRQGATAWASRGGAGHFPLE